VVDREGAWETHRALPADRYVEPQFFVGWQHAQRDKRREITAVAMEDHHQLLAVDLLNEVR
jgi:hypothetical protein